MAGGKSTSVRELARGAIAGLLGWWMIPWRFAVSVLLVVPTIGVVAIGVDQGVRNVVDGWMSGPDFFESVSISPVEYSELPLRWRQALAEIALRDSSETAGLQELIKTLDKEQIDRIDRIATYAVGGLRGELFLVRAANVLLASGTIVPGVSRHELETLEDLGVLQTTSVGMGVQLIGNVFGSSAYLQVQLHDPDDPPSLIVTMLTEAGSELVRTVRAPTDLAYIEWVAKKIEETGLATVKVWIRSPKHLEPYGTSSDQPPDVGEIDRSTLTHIQTEYDLPPESQGN